MTTTALDKLGKHILADFWGCSKLDDPHFIEAILVEAAIKAGATVLTIKLHHFGEGMGVTGVAILTESHISIHSWPEYQFAAVDIFMCGKAQPTIAVEYLKQALQPTKLQIQEYFRGSSFTQDASICTSAQVLPVLTTMTGDL